MRVDVLVATTATLMLQSQIALGDDLFFPDVGLATIVEITGEQYRWSVSAEII